MKVFGLRKDEDKKTLRVKKQDLEISKVRTPTAVGLLTTATQELKKSCVFCGGLHTSVFQNTSPYTTLPSMFLQDVRDGSAPDIDDVEQRLLNKRFRYRQTLHKGLRNRFRSEYLGVPVQKPKRRISNTFKIGQVVLIGSDNRKRIDWPLGVITEFIPGKDKQVRLIKVKTSHFITPYSRINPLEIDSSKDFSSTFKDLEEQRRGDNVPNPSDLRDTSKRKISLDEMKDIGVPNITRTGRHVKIPEKLNL
ncbi:endonuclease [Caerostris extrusa]|uniref:Endonuclease n=1 Tax=Caerostris extrusa TaxID=172846 RepID=A0AAV4U3M8_CAEEX|nr:endonuclease [Caerostris extrusa]